MSIRKVSLQEFQHQIKDVKSQFVDQIKCLEQRTDVQVCILHEINDFIKKRSEIDLEYSKQLDRLVKSVMLKHKNEKQKRANWSLYSSCNLWQQLVDDTKEEAKQRGITAEVYGNYILSSVSTRSTALQKISKKCREIGVLAQGEVLRVIDELFAAMKTYQLCFGEYNTVNAKLQQAEAEMTKAQDSNSSRKQRSVQKNFTKISSKFEASCLKCNRARNEYLLSIEAANASLHKFFADDLSDLIDCTDLGMEYWLNLILTNIISARKAACQTEMNALANLGSFKDSLQPQMDKQKFFESNSTVFMLPKRFEFKSDSTEHANTISLGEGLLEELKQRHYQMCKRLERLRLESDESWRILEQTDHRIRDLLSVSTLIEITEHGIADNRPPEDALESELSLAYEFYLPNFRFYLLNANMIVRLEARADGIGNALVKSNVPFKTSSEKGEMVNDNDVDQNLKINSENFVGSDIEWHEKVRRKKRLGSQASAGADSGGGASNIGIAGSGVQLSSIRRQRPRLFGGSLEEYVELTGEKIPLVVTSCIRVLSQYALHHQGMFRISGSQVEINHMKEMFESGNDPLCDVRDASDVNSIAGVLKLYFRELREPLFPFYLFELLTDCAKCSSTVEFINEMSSLLCKLPRPTYLLLRYLFAFLNHLSEFSDENMMDPYNLAICFGPTLLPIPEGKDQVHYQTYVNEVVKNLIVHHDLIFTARMAGLRYEKYDTTNLTSKNVNNEVDALLGDDNEEYFDSSTPIGTNVSSNTTAGGSATDMDEMIEPSGALNAADFFDYRNYADEILKKKHFQSGENMQNREGVSLSLMNASMVSAGSLGLDNYSECLPSSITATLLKPAQLKSENSNEINSSTKKSDKQTNLTNARCVMEESDLDSFLKHQLHITDASSPRVNILQSKILTYQPPQQARLPTTAAIGIRSSTNADNDDLLNLPLKRDIKEQFFSTSLKKEKQSTDASEQARRSLRSSYNNNQHSSNGEISNNNNNKDIGSESRSRTRDSSRNRGLQQLPPSSPQQKSQDGLQYSQMSEKSDRIRIPLVPPGITPNPTNISHNFNLNRQRSQDAPQQNTSYYHRINNYNRNDTILSSYNGAGGGSVSSFFNTLPNADRSGTDRDLEPNLNKTNQQSSASTLSGKQNGNAASIPLNSQPPTSYLPDQNKKLTLAENTPSVGGQNSLTKTGEKSHSGGSSATQQKQQLPGVITTVTSSRHVNIGGSPTRKGGSAISWETAPANNSSTTKAQFNLTQQLKQQEDAMKSPTKKSPH